MASNLLSFGGGCHCGALGVTFRTALDARDWTVRACQCRFCRAHGALTTTDPAGRLDFQVRRPERLRLYRFGLNTADFLVCSECGVYIGAQIETARGAFGTLNVRVLKPVPPDLPPATPADYDAESPADRTRRREERWTPLARHVVLR
jgi:hypothetical protein